MTQESLTQRQKILHMRSTALKGIISHTPHTMSHHHHIYPHLLDTYLLPGTIIGYITHTSVSTEDIPLILGEGLRAGFYEVQEMDVDVQELQSGIESTENAENKDDSGSENGTEDAPQHQTITRIPIRVTQCGYLRQSQHQNVTRLYMQIGSKTLYVPHHNQPVIAQVAFKSRDAYVLRLTATASLKETGQGTYQLAELAKMDQMAFDGASKRNKPNLQVGAWVYARVIRAERDLDVVLTCETPEGIQKRDWVYADRVMFGELKGGWVVELADMGMSERLLTDEDGILAAIGEVIGYEVVIGANGRAWVNAETPQDTIIVGNVLKNIGTVGWSRGHATKERRVAEAKRMVKTIKEAAEDQKERMDKQMQSFLEVQGGGVVAPGRKRAEAKQQGTSEDAMQEV